MKFIDENVHKKIKEIRENIKINFVNSASDVEKRKRARLSNDKMLDMAIRTTIKKNTIGLLIKTTYIMSDNYFRSFSGCPSTVIYSKYIDEKTIEVRYEREDAINIGSLVEYQMARSPYASIIVKQ